MDGTCEEREVGFGSWRLLPRSRMLLADGVSVPLGSRAFDVLLALVAARGELVTKDELLRQVWPGTVVEENNLQAQVSALRKAFGQDAPHLIATVSGRGYRFTGAVSAAAPLAAARPTMPPAPTMSLPLVVVLPFAIISGEPGQSYFADGLTADLVTDLARFRSLHVVCPRRGGWQPGQAWPFARPNGAPSLPLGPDYLLVGGVQREGERVRVTARLDDAASGVCLWARRFDRPLGDLFAVQDEVAAGIAAHLVSKVDQEAMLRARRRPPASLDAYDLCLRGRDLHARATEADTLLAREHLSRAVALDPDYAPAHSWQAYTLQRGFTHWWGEPRGPDALVAAHAHARRAADLEPDSPLSLACLSFILLLRGRHEEALDASRRAVDLNPSSWVARLDHGLVMTEAGDTAEALREVEAALTLDPFHSPWARYALGAALLLAERQEEALAQLRWCAARLPDYLPGRENMVVAAVEAGRLEEARQALREVLRLGPHWTLRTMAIKWAFLRPAHRERFHAAFRAAGLPEK